MKFALDLAPVLELLSVEFEKTGGGKGGAGKGSGVWTLG